MNDELETLSVRRCPDCRVTKLATAFHSGRLCHACAYVRGHVKHDLPLYRDRRAHARAILITPLGRADLARWRAEEKQAAA